MFIIPISRITPAAMGNTQETAQQTANSGVPFSEILASAYKNAQETREIAQNGTQQLALGEVDDLHTMMINSTKATAAIEFTVELTSRAVSAYKEILQMQI